MGKEELLRHGRVLLHGVLASERGDRLPPLRWMRHALSFCNDLAGRPLCSEEELARREAERVGRSFGYLRQATFCFRTPEEARNLATLAANAAPDPGRVVLGLSELMLNAVEHGNLATGYAEKTRLIDQERLPDEIARRLAAPEYSARTVHLEIERLADRVRFIVRDQGAGFDWTRYLELSPERAFDTHGRGIAMSRLLSFDELEYRGCGNEVVASIAI